MGNVREYGGFLPIDTCDKEYFTDIEDRYIFRMNAARYAIIEAFKRGGYNRIWIPVYMCKSVLDAFKRDGIVAWSYYNIDCNFEPMLDSILEGECILITNYYGQKDNLFFCQMVDKYANVIFDNTQCFFQRPVIAEHVYNVYSARKFVGVSDGAYLIGTGVDDVAMPDILTMDCSGKRAGYLLQSLELGTNECYGDYLSAENDITEIGPKQMSLLTRALLGSINYEAIRKTRNKNHRYFCERLSDINELDVNGEVISPMIYPLLVKDNELRGRLVSNGIYVPQWWKEVLDIPQANDWERYISKYLLPFPIDQRYSVDDLDDMVEIVRKLCDNI